MTDTVRIMPRQPIEAKRDEFGEGYYTERGTSIVHRDYLNSGGVGWVEVSDPIVWDGTDGAFEAIRSALSGIADDVLAPNTDGVLRELVLLCHGGGVLSCTHGGRIQLVGSSFAILPPEATS